VLSIILLTRHSRVYRIFWWFKSSCLFDGFERSGFG